MISICGQSFFSSSRLRAGRSSKRIAASHDVNLLGLGSKPRPAGCMFKLSCLGLFMLAFDAKNGVQQRHDDLWKGDRHI